MDAPLLKNIFEEGLVAKTTVSLYLMDSYMTRRVFIPTGLLTIMDI
jgi:hypothetical protein